MYPRNRGDGTHWNQVSDLQKTSKLFIESWTRKRPKEIYTVVKPEPCKECGKLFMKVEILRSHNNIDTEEKSVQNKCSGGLGLAQFKGVQDYIYSYFKPLTIITE